MEKEIIIKYNWNCNDDIDEIPEDHRESLEEAAMKRIFEMTQEGCTSGELHESIRFGKDQVPEEDEEEGLSYSGWWSLFVKTI